MKIGEILVAAKLASRQQIAEALKVQEQRKARLAAILILQKTITPDQAALALARQCDLPPALVRHFVNYDPRVLSLIPGPFAKANMVVPIAFSGSGKGPLVLCMRNPRDKRLISQIKKAIGRELLPCVASELTIQAYLQHYYADSTTQEPSTRATEEHSEDLDVDVDLGDFEAVQSDAFELVELDHHGVERTSVTHFNPSKSQNIGLAALKEAMSAQSDDDVPKAEAELAAGTKRLTKQLDPEQVRNAIASPLGATPVSALVAPLESETKVSSLGFGEVLERIAKADKRSQIDEAVLLFMRNHFEGALMFTIKEGLAMGHLGYGGHLDDPETVVALMLPLGGTILGSAHSQKKLWQGRPEELSTVAQKRFLKLFDRKSEVQEAVVVPLLVGSKVACLLYGHGKEGQPLGKDEVAQLQEVGSAAQDGYKGLIAKRRAKPS